MPTPFPGMDPFLEQRGLWSDVHPALIVTIRDYLAPLLRPRYFVAIELRVYVDSAFVEPAHTDLVGRPDLWVTESQPGEPLPRAQMEPAGPTPLLAELPVPQEKVKERYLEVREVTTGDVITAIELLSPSNKRSGAGRREYEEKRNKILASQTHLVEIDLIRSGTPMPMRLRNGSPGEYRILVSRAAQRPFADVYAFPLRDPIPDFPVPLQPGEPEPTVPLNRLLHDLYERVGYDLVIDYQRRLDPPLSPEDAAWVEALIRSARAP